VATIGFSMAACKEDTPPDPSGAKTISGTATADQGDLYFSFFRDNGGAESCDFTTDLPAPNDVFTLTDDEMKSIYGITPPNRKVEWTATVKTGLIEQTSGNPIYSVRVNTVE
jgi:hypothetical protein